MHTNNRWYEEITFLSKLRKSLPKKMIELYECKLELRWDDMKKYL